MNLSTLWIYYYSDGVVTPPPPPPPPGKLQVITFDIQRLAGGLWESLLVDVRTVEPPVIEYGFRDARPDNFVAPSGYMTFALNNASSNSGSELGYYSPLRPGDQLALNDTIRLTVTYLSSTRYVFYGRISEIVVTPGAQADRMVRVRVLDLMNDYSEISAPAVQIESNKTGDQLIQLLLNGLPDPTLYPPQLSFDQGPDRHVIAFDGYGETTATMREVLHAVCASDFSKLMVVGSRVDPGGRLVYRNRHYAALNPTVLFELEEDDIARDGLDPITSRKDLISGSQIEVHPPRIDAVATVLYSLGTTILIQNGQYYDGLFAEFRSADATVLVGAMNVVPVVAGFDYTMNTAADGSGTDLTSQFIVTGDYSSGMGVKFTLWNKSGFPGYVTLLQVRGRGIYRSTEVATSRVTTTYGNRDIHVEMPFQGNLNVATDVAHYLTNTYATPQARVAAVTFMANKRPETMAASLDLEPGERVALSESVTWLDGHQFIIAGKRIEVQPSAVTPILWCTWFLEPADTLRYWTLGQGDSGILGVTTVAAW